MPENLWPVQFTNPDNGKTIPADASYYRLMARDMMTKLEAKGEVDASMAKFLKNALRGLTDQHLTDLFQNSNDKTAEQNEAWNNYMYNALQYLQEEENRAGRELPFTLKDSSEYFGSALEPANESEMGEAGTGEDTAGEKPAMPLRSDERQRREEEPDRFAYSRTRRHRSSGIAEQAEPLRQPRAARIVETAGDSVAIERSTPRATEPAISPDNATSAEPSTQAISESFAPNYLDEKVLEECMALPTAELIKRIKANGARVYTSQLIQDHARSGAISQATGIENCPSYSAVSIVYEKGGAHRVEVENNELADPVRSSLVEQLASSSIRLMITDKMPADNRIRQEISGQLEGKYVHNPNRYLVFFGNQVVIDIRKSPSGKQKFAAVFYIPDAPIKIYDADDRPGGSTILTLETDNLEELYALANKLDAGPEDKSSDAEAGMLVIDEFIYPEEAQNAGVVVKRPQSLNYNKWRDYRWKKARGLDQAIENGTIGSEGDFYNNVYLYSARDIITWTGEIKGRSLQVKVEEGNDIVQLNSGASVGESQGQLRIPLPENKYVGLVTICRDTTTIPADALVKFSDEMNYKLVKTTYKRVGLPFFRREVPVQNELVVKVEAIVIKDDKVVLLGPERDRTRIQYEVFTEQGETKVRVGEDVYSFRK